MIKNEKFKILMDDLNLQMQKLLYNNSDDNEKAQMRIRHSFRVTDIALNLAKYYSERYSIDDNKMTLLEIGAMMHDCAKFIDDDTHDLLGSIIVGSILRKKKYKEIEITENDINQIVYMIESHSDKGQDIALNSTTILKAILIDADIMEKIISYYNSESAFDIDRVRDYYNRKRRYIKTEKGGEMIDRLMSVINNIENVRLGISNTLNKLTVDFNNPSNKNIDEK